MPSNRTKLRQGDHPQLDKELYKWFVTMRGIKVEVSGLLLQQQAGVFKNILNNILRKNNLFYFL